MIRPSKSTSNMFESWYTVWERRRDLKENLKEGLLIGIPCGRSLGRCHLLFRLSSAQGMVISEGEHGEVLMKDFACICSRPVEIIAP